MKKVYLLENLDCPNCAVKMQNKIAKIEGVSDVNVSFMSQKIVLDLEEDKIQEIESQMIKVCRKVEPDCRILV